MNSSMSSEFRTIVLAMVTGVVLCVIGCGRGTTTTEESDHDRDHAHEADDEHDHGHGDDRDDHDHEHDHADGPTVAIPQAVRSNLGITFVTVEQRHIEQTLRVPGRFEYLPTARRAYRTPVPGRIELLVDQFDRVDIGTPLYRIDSPDWRSMQGELAEAESQIERLTARFDTFGPLLAAHGAHEQSLADSVEVWRERVAQLESVREAGGGRVDELTQARASLASTRAELASVQEKKAQLGADQRQTEADLRAARVRLEYLFDAAAALTDVDRDGLAAIDQDGRPGWGTIGQIVVRAAGSGVVEQLDVTNGAWADERSAVLAVVQPERLRFRASGLQSDLGVLRDGLAARIVPPAPTAAGRSVPLQSTMSGAVQLGLAGDPADRTLDVFVVPGALLPWARPGVSAQLEIVTETAAEPEPAIPLAAVQRDGLRPVIFVRSDDDPDEAIRVEVDLGADDGRWVALHGGVHVGDEVVLDGAFQLMLATSGSMQQGGHFHADGTFHAGEDEEH